MKALRERQAKGLAEPYKEVWMNERKWMNGWMNEWMFQWGILLLTKYNHVNATALNIYLERHKKKYIDPKSKFYATSCIDLFIRRSCIMLWNVLYRVVHCVKALKLLLKNSKQLIL